MLGALGLLLRRRAKREREGRGKCETFDFLGFTHLCGKTRVAKRFALKRITIASRMRRTLAAVKEQLERRRHDAPGQTGRWLASVVRGWQGYHGVPDNYDRLEQFDKAITKLWRRQLQRRSQRGKSRWPMSRMGRLVRKYFLVRVSLNPVPTFGITPDSEQEPYEGILHVRICAGGRRQRRSLVRL
jgi:RNA-directed DNA polymerase